MLADHVQGRLEAIVPALAGGVANALNLAEMMRRKALPQRAVSAFVVPSGITGGGAQSSQDAFLQAAEEAVSVALILRTAGDVLGARTAPQLDELVWSVIFAIAGWAPELAPDEEASGTDPVGVFELRRGRVNSLDAGTVFYQLDFAIAQQVRVVS